MTAAPAAAQTPARARPSFRVLTDVYSAKCMLLGPRLMKDLGLTDLQAAGLLGNLGHESGGFRQLQEVGHRSGRGGWGLAQWTGPRRRAMEAWCRTHKFDPASDEGNYQFLLVELRGSEAASLRALKTEHTLEGATGSFMRHFERPGIPHLPGRITWARKALPAIRKGLASHEAVVAAVAAKPAPTPAKPVALAKKAAPRSRVASAPHHGKHHA